MTLLTATVRRILATMASLAIVVCAHADLTPVTRSTDNTLPNDSRSQAICASVVQTNSPTPIHASVDDLLPWHLAPWSEQALPTSALTSSVQGQEPLSEVLELPPGPSSASLFLSALASVGVWQLGRSARKMNLGVLPEWYHASATQVGHSTPLDLDFNLSALPFCQFTAPTDHGEPKPTGFWHWEVPRDSMQSQYYLHATKPRGPPIAC